MTYILLALAGTVLAVAFFTGWAAVFFGMTALGDRFVPYTLDSPPHPWWKWSLWWGAYLGAILSYPFLVGMAVATMVGG